MRVHSILLASTLAIVLPGLSLAQDISDDRIKALIAETLRENPELVLEALQALEARQAEAQAAAAAAVLTRRARGAWNATQTRRSWAIRMAT